MLSHPVQEREVSFHLFKNAFMFVRSVRLYFKIAFQLLEGLNWILRNMRTCKTETAHATFYAEKRLIPLT